MLNRWNFLKTGFYEGIKVESILEELNPSYKFELAESPTQPVWDLRGTSPDAPDIFVQVKVGGEGYADQVVDAMQEDPNIDSLVKSLCRSN